MSEVAFYGFRGLIGTGGMAEGGKRPRSPPADGGLASFDPDSLLAALRRLKLQSSTTFALTVRAFDGKGVALHGACL